MKKYLIRKLENNHYKEIEMLLNRAEIRILIDFARFSSKKNNFLDYQIQVFSKYSIKDGKYRFDEKDNLV